MLFRNHIALSIDYDVSGLKRAAEATRVPFVYCLFRIRASVGREGNA